MDEVNQKQKSSKPTTRVQTYSCPVFGKPSHFKRTLLPTYEDVLKEYLCIRDELRRDGRLKEPNVAEVADLVTTQIVETWTRASVPVISRQRIIARVKEYYEKYRKLLKHIKERGKTDTFNHKVELFRSEAKKLFDVAACKCANFEDCICARDKKVPIQERGFLVDQRTDSKLMIGLVDSKATKQLQIREKRKQIEAERNAKKCREDREDVCISVEPQKDSDEELLDEQEHHTTNIPTTSTAEQNKPVQMRKKLPTLARECDRWGLSDRSAAAVASAVLKDFGLIDNKDSSCVIDQNKIRRERERHRKELQTNLENIILQGLYFDGRKDRTNKQIQKGSAVYHPITLLEEHVVLVAEPGSKYLGHVTPQSGHSTSITNSITSFLTLNEISSDNLVAIGCDGTNVNTGSEGGIIRLMELHCNRSLHCFVCLLHMNELPFRHLLIQIDGATHGPNSFSGPIGKALKSTDFDDLGVQSFQNIDGNKLPDVDVKDLSNDQRYLYEICVAVTSGVCSKELANRKPGPLAHSRWLTAASRLLRLYVATKNPSKNLITLVTYVVKVYAPIWFEIKTKPSCSDGARHTWKMILYSRYLPQDVKEIVDVVIQRNAYFAHSENLLLSMISDEREVIRKVAFRRILLARASEKKGETRKFKVPAINFTAAERSELSKPSELDYVNLIEWALEATERFEPPLLRSLSQEALETYDNGTVTPILNFRGFPSHTQAVERSVRLVTEASSAVSEAQRRDGFIRARLESRSLMPSFNKKSDFPLQ